MRNYLLPLLMLTACSPSSEETEGGLSLNIDPARITVSGVSSGAHMAHQLHIAYSDIFSGAGIVSGGPYNCANNSLEQGLNQCMMNTDLPIDVNEIAAGIRAAAAAGELADPANLADDRVWLFRGTNDSKISSQVHGAAAELYAEFIPAEQVVSIDDVVADHVFPADGQGGPCDEVTPPYVGDCGYDAAGQLLQFLYGDLEPPTGEAVIEHLFEVALPGAGGADMLETAYLYIPADCADGRQACALHLVLHGCAQSTEAVGTDFITLSGYLPWAEANDIVLAFPQAEKSMMAPLNPYGCWDWWGYTGDDYATRNGPQMKTIVDWLQGLAKQAGGGA
jgi:poly(3-hydroxybutyrate) depolymerase